MNAEYFKPIFEALYHSMVCEGGDGDSILFLKRGNVVEVGQMLGEFLKTKPYSELCLCDNVMDIIVFSGGQESIVVAPFSKFEELHRSYATGIIMV